jgi:hypothetical protein
LNVVAVVVVGCGDGGGGDVRWCTEHDKHRQTQRSRMSPPSLVRRSGDDPHRRRPRTTTHQPSRARPKTATATETRQLGSMATNDDGAARLDEGARVRRPRHGVERVDLDRAAEDAARVDKRAGRAARCAALDERGTPRVAVTS